MCSSCPGRIIFSYLISYLRKWRKDVWQMRAMRLTAVQWFAPGGPAGLRASVKPGTRPPGRPGVFRAAVSRHLQGPRILQTVVKVAEWAARHLWRKHSTVFQGQGRVPVPSNILIGLLEPVLGVGPPRGPGGELGGRRWNQKVCCWRPALLFSPCLSIRHSLPEPRLPHLWAQDSEGSNPLTKGEVRRPEESLCG